MRIPWLHLIQQQRNGGATSYKIKRSRHVILLREPGGDDENSLTGTGSKHMGIATQQTGRRIDDHQSALIAAADMLDEARYPGPHRY